MSRAIFLMKIDEFLDNLALNATLLNLKRKNKKQGWQTRNTFRPIWDISSRVHYRPVILKHVTLNCNYILMKKVILKHNKLTEM